MTTTEALAIFEKALHGSNYSPRTIRAYTDDVKQYLAFVQKRRVDWDIPSRLDRTDIVEFINHLAALKATGVTRFRKLASLRKFFRFLQENQVIYGCPTDTIKSPLKEEKDPPVLQKNEYKALLYEARENARDFAILQLFLQTGIRVGELSALTMEDIDLTNKTLTVRQGKGKKDRTIPLEDQALASMTRYLKGRSLFPPDETVFLAKNGSSMDVRTVRLMVKKYLKKAGITKKASVHTLRHTFGTHKVDRGITLPSYADRHIFKIGHYIKDHIETRVSGMGWEHKMFADRYMHWMGTIVPKFKNYIPPWSFREYSHAEVSALISFIGSTVLSLLLWASEMFFGTGQASGKGLAVTWYSAIILLLLDVGVILLAYSFIRNSHRNFDIYIKYYRGHLPHQSPQHKRQSIN